MNLDSVVFYSHDIEKIIEYYVNELGFKLEYSTSGKFASFIFPNGARLSVKKATEEREVPGAQSVFIAVTGIEQLYKDIKGKGLDIRKELTYKDYGIEFSILDSDKNKIQFIQRKKS
ncbi:MAG: glyoxalase superfamily protein [Patescibacteria group bacterium]